MKTSLLIVLIATTALGGAAHTASRRTSLRELQVTGHRPMKETGIQQTVFDSLTLKDNIALSMADILTYNSPLFVKNYGRATLSTVSFRGTSPSHTQVTWNDMKINNPMLGMTDFSTIPSFFIDKASLLHGSSSLNETGGALGGMVKLGTSADMSQGIGLQYIQGAGSFKTFDEFIRLTYGSNKWHVSTRAAYSSSPNDYRYTNHDKKINIYDEEHNIVGQYHPVERNRSGAYKDLHILQEIYYTPSTSDRVSLNVWYLNSNRELPMLTTDYGDERAFENRQREQTVRSVVAWSHSDAQWKTDLRGGYIHIHSTYDYRREVSEGNMMSMTASRSRLNTLFGKVEWEYNPIKNWYFTANASINQHFVKSKDDNMVFQYGEKNISGYDQSRMECSGALSAKWQATNTLGTGVTVREEAMGNRYSPVIPAVFVDGLVSKRGNVMLKASASRNHRFPTLNDLYFMPGGNPDLRDEKGWAYDAGISFDTQTITNANIRSSGSVTWFDSRVDDWILWLPTTKGFFSPRNIKRVHSYGVESRLNISIAPKPELHFDVNVTYSWTPSKNQGEKISPADKSVGKQLPYVPLHSANISGRVTWRSWGLLYKWAYYSERYTMSSNDYTISGHLPEYYMSNLQLEKRFSLHVADLQAKLAINNLFNEDYLSVLSRPMPGINFEFFISITPKFHHAKTLPTKSSPL